MTPPTQDDLAAVRRRVTNALHEMHPNQQIWISAELAHELDAAWNAYDAAVLAAARGVLLRQLSEAVRFHWRALTEQGTACQFCERSSAGPPTDFEHDPECVVLLV